MGKITVRDAVLELVRVCDGAFKRDGQGFNAYDAPYIRELLKQDTWTLSQQEKVYKLLRKYTKQLAEHGIRYEDIQVEKTSQKDMDNQPMILTVDSEGRLILKSSFEFRNKAKAIPFHKWIPEEKVWRYLPKPETVEGLLPYIQEGIIQPMQAAQVIIDEIIAKQEAARKQVQEVAAIRTQETVEVTVPLKTQLYDHQKKAFAVGITLDHAALLMEQGTGKTLSAIAVMGHRFIEGQIKRLLIIAPLSVIPVWRAEFQKHAAFSFRIEVLTDISIEDRRQILTDWKDTEGLQVVVTNYESTWRMEEELKRWNPDGIILDESQKIKNGRAKQSQAIHRLGKVAKYRMILTGTPVTQSPLDVWSQYKFLNPQIFGTRFLPFRDRYAVMGGYGGYEVVGYKNLEELAEKAHSIAYRVTKAEALDLPETVDQYLYCHLEGEAQRVYQEMAHNMVATLNEDKKISAPIILTQLLRLQQITGGFLPDSEGTPVLFHTSKLDLLQEVMESLPRDKKVVIFARFITEIQQIAERLQKTGWTVTILTGETKNRGEVVKRFQEESDPKVIVIQIQTGGLGITLTTADTVIFYSATFSYADYEQAKARVHRIGQKNKVTYIHLITTETVDEVILEALQNKRDIAELVIDTYKEERTMAKKSANVTEPLTSLEEKEMVQALEELRKELETENQEISEKEDLQVEAQENRPVQENSKKKESQVISDDIVTVKDLADEFNLTPITVRRKLRESDISKPGGRWEWPKDHPDLAKIKEILS